MTKATKILNEKLVGLVVEVINSDKSHACFGNVSRVQANYIVVANEDGIDLCFRYNGDGCNNSLLLSEVSIRNIKRYV